MPSRVEAEVRLQINTRLQAKGWVLDPQASERNVFVERGVLERLSSIQQSRLGGKSPDYTLFTNGTPTAILEAKKPGKTIENAFEDGCDYADRIGVDYVFACNGPTFKTLHTPSGEPLHLNQVEIFDPIPPSVLNRFSVNNTSRILTISEHVIESRGELLTIFERVNSKLRTGGIRAGLDRFTEFANILFLKLLSEQEEDSDLWNKLIYMPDRDLPNFLNGFVLDKLRGMYGSDVLSETQTTGKTLKEIIRELNPLCLSSVDEDIKGMSFEHFLRRTTSVQNDLGEYFTPRHVVRFMVKLLNPQFGKTIFDPFCGTGGFLTEAFRHLGSQIGNTYDAYEQLHHKSLYGMEITKNARIAKMNMILFGDGHSGVVKGNSLDPENLEKRYDYVLSNIPFSLDLESDTIKTVDQNAKDADEACLLKCFNSLHTGGAMAVIVPDGLVVNRAHKDFWRYLCQNSHIRMIASLPRGTFAPYTDAATKIVYLTDKYVKRTKWFYDVNLIHDHGHAMDMDKFLFFYQAQDTPPNIIPVGIEVVTVTDNSKASFSFNRPWKIDASLATVPLREVANIRNGTAITQAEACAGQYPVIAGGRGTVRYTHNKSNADGCCFTISKSGAYAGYVWWHQKPIWSSDSLIVRSRSEENYLSFYLYLCLKTKQYEIYDRQQGTGQPHIYSVHVEDFPIPILPLEDQKQLVADAYEDLLTALNAQEHSNDSMRTVLSVIDISYRRNNDGNF